jgi:hypothetical protein
VSRLWGRRCFTYPAGVYKANRFEYVAICQAENRLDPSQTDRRFGPTESDARTVLAAFILAAKTQYGVRQLGAIVGATTTRVMAYTQGRPWQTRFDVLSLEMGHDYYIWQNDQEVLKTGKEFWNILPCGLIDGAAQGGHGWSANNCRNTTLSPFMRPTAFGQYLTALRDLRNQANANNLLVEAYIGYPTANRTLTDPDSRQPVTELEAVMKRVDRLLVHAYARAPESTYGKLNALDVYNAPSTRHRMDDLKLTDTALLASGATSKATDLWILWSGESTMPDPTDTQHQRRFGRVPKTAAGGTPPDICDTLVLKDQNDFLGEPLYDQGLDSTEGYLDGCYWNERQKTAVTWEDRVSLGGCMYFTSEHLRYPALPQVQYPLLP